MGFGEAKIGPVLHGYPVNIVLGIQQIRPLMLDALAQELSKYEIAWTEVKFVEVNKDQVPTEPGVYFFSVRPRAANIENHHIILYVGKAKVNLRDRYINYLRERHGLKISDRDKVVKMLNIYKDRVFFSYCTLDMYDVERVEDALLMAFDPPCNTMSPKFEPAF